MFCEARRNEENNNLIKGHSEIGSGRVFTSSQCNLLIQGDPELQETPPGARHFFLFAVKCNVPASDSLVHSLL